MRYFVPRICPSKFYTVLRIVAQTDAIGFILPASAAREIEDGTIVALPFTAPWAVANWRVSFRATARRVLDLSRFRRTLGRVLANLRNYRTIKFFEMLANILGAFGDAQRSHLFCKIPGSQRGAAGRFSGKPNSFVLKHTKNSLNREEFENAH